MSLNMKIQFCVFEEFETVDSIAVILDEGCIHYDSEFFVGFVGCVAE